MKFIFFPINGYTNKTFLTLNSERWHLPFITLRDKLVELGHTVEVFPCIVNEEEDIGIYFATLPLYSAPLCKKSLFIQLEPPCISNREYERINSLPFTRILTFSLDHVNNDKIFYSPFPLIKPLQTNNISKRDKVCIAIFGNKTSNHPDQLYSARRHAMLAFGKDCDVFGAGWQDDREVIETCNWLGRLNGPKFDAMKNYKYAICFENQYVKGYCSEKLPDAINAGCTPIHRGWTPTYQFSEAYEDKWSDYIIKHLQELI